MNGITSRDQFKPIRIRENLGVNYNCQYFSRTDIITPWPFFFLFFISEKPEFGFPLLLLEHFYASLHFRTHNLFHCHLERGKSLGCSRGADAERFLYIFCDLRLKKFLRCILIYIVYKVNYLDNTSDFVSRNDFDDVEVILQLEQL